MTSIHHGKFKWLLAACCIFLLVGILQATKVRPSADPKTLNCSDCGHDRSYYLYAGNGGNTADPPQDLVLVLHGYGSSAERTIARTKGAFEHLAETENMVVVHGQAEESNWVFGDTASKGDTYDFNYFEALWDQVRNDHASLKRIHLVGLSRGSMAAYALACEGTLPIASLTVFVMPMPVYSHTNCRSKNQIDFMLANGTEDQIVPYHGGQINLPWYAFAGDRDFGSVLSTEDTLAYWRNRNGCETDPSDGSTLDNVSDGTSIVLRTWESCVGSRIIHFEVQGGGHRWLNERWDPIAWVLLGSTSREVRTSAIAYLTRDSE